MPESIEDLQLVVRDNQRESVRRARQNLMLAAMSGKPVDMADVARSRGLVLRERENSIFSDAWIPLAFIFLIVGLLADRNAAMIALGLVLLLIVGVSTVWKNLSLWGVTYEREFDRTRVFPGEPITMSIRVQNRKALPLTWLRFRDEMPVPPNYDDPFVITQNDLTNRYTLQNTFSMQRREQIERTATLAIGTRGFYTIGPVAYESGDLFTLFTVEREYKYLHTLVVYPQIFPLEDLGLPAKEPFRRSQSAPESVH